MMQYDRRQIEERMQVPTRKEVLRDTFTYLALYTIALVGFAYLLKMIVEWLVL
jgi:preprotein translocase subunit SecE